MSGFKFKLLITDIDNTVFDWVAYYVNALHACLSHVEKVVGVPVEKLMVEAQAIFSAHASIEYPFLVQEMPSVIKHYGEDLDALLSEAVEPAREAFKKEAIKWLVPYEGVKETFDKLRKNKDLVIVALTDAPRYVAMWKLNKLGLLHEFSAVYGLADPKLPTDPVLGRVKVNPKILLKHLQQSNFDFKGKIRILPDEYEKPGVRGLRTVLMDYEEEDSDKKRQNVLWVGDNLRKDVSLGQKVGVSTAWAAYGTKLNPKWVAELKLFSPPNNVHKNVALDPADPNAPKPDFTLAKFSDLLTLK